MKTMLEMLERELALSEKLLEKVERELVDVPYGRLRISKSRSAYTYYLLDEKDCMATPKCDLTENNNELSEECIPMAEGNIEKAKAISKDGRYLSRKETALIRKLAQKDYNLRMKKLLQARIKRLSILIHDYRDMDLFTDFEKIKDGRKSMIRPIVPGKEEFLSEWENVKYEGRPFYSNDAAFVTEKGERVRSKSEVLLANLFYKYKVPYHYEKPVRMKGLGLVYPDFTLVNLKTRREYIWEHFGMMDNENYAEHMVKKVNQYRKNGYSIGENFLISMETSKSPIDMKYVELQIKQFLL